MDVPLESLPYDYVLFVDEAGDDGLTRVQPIDAGGSSEWLVVTGLLVRAEDESRCRTWLEAIRTDINALQAGTLHFRKLSPKKQLRAADLVASLPMKIFTACSNKKNMRGYNNTRAAQAGGKQWFYNWVVRIMMERATEYCAQNGFRKLGRACKCKVLFSSRGGHSYGQTKAYWELLRAQQRNGGMFLNRYQIRHEILSFRLVDYVPHYMHAGLQLADICASSFYQAVEASSPRWSTSCAKLLEPIVAKAHGIAADVGLVLQPHRIDTIGLSSDQKQIFQHYGYRFRGD